MTKNEPKLWEVWQFEFAFEDNPQITKKRPVIIVAKDNNQEEIVLLTIKVTSHPPRKESRRPPKAPIKLGTKIKAPYFVHPLVHHQFFTRY